MNFPLTVAFLFAIGSLVGWVIEFFFRHYFSSDNPDHKWVNPGFCVGPYLPLYGFGLVALFLLSLVSEYFDMFSSIWLIIIWLLLITVILTVIEYIAGIISTKIFHVKLWDYSDCWGNIQGIICPLFSLFWTILGVIYLLLIHQHIINLIVWLSNNLAFSFFIGMFYGIFIIDVIYSSKILVKIKKFADENEVIVHIEKIKAEVIRMKQERKEKNSLFSQLSISQKHLNEILTEVKEEISEILSKKTK
ncbi:MAG: hypothetical protein ACI4WG_05430 [Erysipelotrichaceae bacterium]